MVIGSEILIIEGSPLIGLTLGTITDKYKVIVVHYHNPHQSFKTRKKYDPKAVIQKDYAINVKGPENGIMRLGRDSVSFN
jgi:hypothetical protein